MNFSRSVWRWPLAAVLVANLASAQDSSPPIRFIDSATGYAVQPELTVLSHQTGETKNFSAARIGKNGRPDFLLEQGRHTLTAGSPNHQPLGCDIELRDGDPYLHQFVLEPLELPRELQPSRIDSLRRADASIAVGFVVDDESSEPVPNVHVRVNHDAETTTDTRGFFQLAIPVLSAELDPGVRVIAFEKNSFAKYEEKIVVWPTGDCTMRVRLKKPGAASTIQPKQKQSRTTPTQTATVTTTIIPKPLTAESPSTSLLIGTRATAPTNATIRIPRTIRVLLNDNVTINYVAMETYTKHVLPHEWIASWGNYTGGGESLKAGAPVVRAYAIAKLNAVGTSATYDICGTSSCQNYNTTTYSTTDSAADQTVGYVCVSGSSIVSTEYSSEDNSTGFTCGDGYTEPSTTGPVCTYDPVCSGETRFGHGRGMCQWGTFKWATGLKFPGNSTSNATLTNGYPKKDWTWIVNHYFPTYKLVHCTPLVVGDDVKANTTTLSVRMNADGSISNATAVGINCPQVGTEASGATGVIIDATNNPVPLWVTNDGRGYTWYKVQWSDSLVGWSSENWLQRIIPAPATAPSGLTATAVATNQININWTAGAGQSDYIFQRSLASGGPWTTIDTLAGTATSYVDKEVYPNTTYYYRVRGHNLAGNSALSNVDHDTTLAVLPTLAAIANKTINEGSTLTFTNSASAPDFVTPLTDFEFDDTGNSSGIVLFNKPSTSGTTSGNITAPPDFDAVLDLFPTNGNTSTRALLVNFSFSTSAVAPWLRLTTSGATTLPNPVIDLTKRLRFSISSSKSLQVGVGCRETTNAVGTAIGSDGGTAGGIEWAGVTNKNGSTPMPTRTIAANTWTSLTFNFPAEPILNFSGGNGVLSTASGLGVLEHLALVPGGGTGIYTVWLDNFAVVQPKTFTYSLAGAPSGASVNPGSGVFSWTPSETQGPGVYNISVIVTDNSSPALSRTNTFSVTVNEVNQAPTLTAIANQTIHAGTTLLVTNSASDSDLPANTLTFSLDPGAPVGASLTVFNSTNCTVNWPTSDADAGTTNSFTVRVTDNGAPSSNAAKTFSATVLPRPAFQSSSIDGNTLTLAWSAILGKTYRVQWKTNLEDANWNNLSDVTASGSSASVNDTLGITQRFYRILALN